MKTVYTADMVAHLWANHHTAEVRTPTRNLYTEAGALYSYGCHWVVGAFITNKKGEALLLWNGERASTTTAKHAAYARRALTADQWQGRAEVPSMDYRALGDLPGLAARCVNWAVAPLEKCEKARGRMPAFYAEARARLETARRLFIFAGRAREACKVPAMAEEASKAGAAAALVALRRNVWLADVEKATTTAAAFLADVPRYLANPEACDALGVMRELSRAASSIATARSLYKKAGKDGAPPKITGLAKTLEAARVIFEPQARALEIAKTRQDIADRTVALVAELADAQRLKKAGKGNGALSWALGKLADIAPRSLGDAAFYWGDAGPAKLGEIQGLMRRARAVDTTYTLRRALKTTADNIARYTDRPATWPVPSGVPLRQTVGMWETCPPYWARKALALADQADALKATHAEREALANAERIKAWRAGERVSLPRDVGPLVRIIGATLQTSWGAEVPLDHAARLLKIARRVQAAGGANYTKNDGPTVGHFRVNSIASDFSMVIGCHPFTAAECEHAAALIDAITETTTA